MLAIAIVTLIAAGGSFFCSLMEAAFYSIPPSKIEELKRAGHKGGIRLARLRADVDKPIAAILTLNTFANSAGAAFAGYLVGNLYGNVMVGVYSVVFTLIVLYLSEIIPKTLGVTYANRLAPMLSGPIVLMVRVFYFPFIIAARQVTHFIRKGGGDPDAPSEQQILALAEMGAEMGTLLEEEARWAMNALRLNDVTARDLMTPRTVVYLLPADLPLSEVKARSDHWSHSRLPVVKNNDPDTVEGIVYRRDVFDELVRLDEESHGVKTIRDLMHPAIFVPDKLSGNELLKRFLEERQELLIVANEYGGMEGVVSIEDVLEHILGEEIVDRHDKHVDMQQFAREVAARRQQRVQLRRRRRDEAGGKQDG